MRFRQDLDQNKSNLAKSSQLFQKRKYSALVVIGRKVQHCRVLLFATNATISANGGTNSPIRSIS